MLDVPLPSRPSRFHWLHASWLVLCSIAGFVALFFLPEQTALWARFSIALAIGAIGGIAMTRLTRVILDERLWRMCRHLPRRLQIEQQSDGSLVCFFERLDGEPGVFTLPEGYDPREDEGRQLFELLGIEVTQ